MKESKKRKEKRGKREMKKKRERGKKGKKVRVNDWRPEPKLQCSGKKKKHLTLPVKPFFLFYSFLNIIFFILTLFHS